MSTLARDEFEAAYAEVYAAPCVPDPVHLEWSGAMTITEALRVLRPGMLFRTTTIYGDRRLMIADSCIYKDDRGCICLLARFANRTTRQTAVPLVVPMLTLASIFYICTNWRFGESEMNDFVLK